MPAQIRRLDAQDSALMMGMQCYASPVSVVRALVENALDAHAKTIRVRVCEYGLQEIIVTDDGEGIGPDLLSRLGREYVTTRQTPYTSLGYRGEALRALTTIASVTVLSAREGESQEGVVAYKCVLNDEEPPVMDVRDGIGTTITIKELYAKVPARRRYFQSSALRRRLQVELLEYLTAIALAHPHVGFVVIDNHTSILSLPATDSTTVTAALIRDRFLGIFGRRYDELCGEWTFRNLLGYGVVGFISKANGGEIKHNKRQLSLSLGGRLIRHPATVQALLTAFSRVSATTVPVGALSLLVPNGAYVLTRNTDVDTVQIQNSSVFVDLIREEYLKWLLRTNQDSPPTQHIVPSLQEPSIKQVSETTNTHDANGSLIPSTPVRPGQQNTRQSSHTTLTTASAIQRTSTMTTPSVIKGTASSSPIVNAPTMTKMKPAQRKVPAERTSGVKCMEFLFGTPTTVSQSSPDDAGPNLHRLPYLPRPRNPVAAIPSEETVSDDVYYGVGAIRRGEPAIPLTISAFAGMQVICQFNKAFLIVRLGEQLFLVDQHAADEAHNFSLLWSELKGHLEVQALIAPQPVDLCPTELLCYREYAETRLFEACGFATHPSSRPNTQEGHGRVFLRTSACLLGRTLDSTDFLDILHRLVDADCDALKGALLRAPDPLEVAIEAGIIPKRFRRIVASKACKSSVRLGDPLAPITASRVVHALADCGQPFHCPHGRPVLRVLHVGGIRRTASETPQFTESIDQAKDEVILSEDSCLSA
ncbi:Pms1-like protein [Giardia muris]|uniref:Pms1-like protein n=1 Tax=Giardia muris TaxID=5742 RepID=A0A4Z1SYU8_GIAMU|nr:Pms1-like protein [Giardia muris]|eukprot:TNJ26843.1 Pms1-like protein [Giardia muris]